MADIFNEIDEDLRRDQLKRLWDRYSTLILAVAFLIVAGVAGWRGYEYYQAQQAREVGERYFAALKLSTDGDHKGAEEAFRQLGRTGHGGYPLLSALREAAESAMQGETAAALKAYDAIAASPSTPPTFAGLARIRAAYLALDVEERPAVEARATPLVVGGNPWRHSAREVLALAAWKAGDAEAAKKRIDELLNDAEVPRAFTARAEILMALIRAAAGPAKAATAQTQ
ncbi:tetratricopeptide repeat protein [Prosthecomicrobium sp. N25]|uniref:tetratricopeptide repeat protein n=1 Tax=Prosthecomicrobium sp. N25 TaxID=3129254 RepID=UPI0030768928